ncbi:MAG: NAD(P)-dependent oxidoreductase [Acetobacteraceae bacterium]
MTEWRRIEAPARVAFLGLGIMGGAMAANLLAAGYRLSLFSRTRAKAAALEAAGAAWRDSPAEAARDADALCLCLPDTPDVEAAIFGPAGAAEALRPGAVVVDFSTVSAEASRRWAARLAERGVGFLDSPVSGGPKGAKEATLTCFVGGEAAVFDAALPLLRAVGRTITHLGPAGAGQTGKSANQIIVTATMLAIGEGFALARKAGISPKALREALMGGSARSFVLENHAKRVVEEDRTVGFRAELMAKDLRLAVAAAASLGVVAPGAAATSQWLAMLEAAGRGGEDVSALVRLAGEWSGVG